MSPTGQPLAQALASCHSAFEGGTILAIKQRPEMLHVRRIDQAEGEPTITKRSTGVVIVPAGEWLITRLTGIDKPKRLASGALDVWTLTEDRLFGAYNLLQHERLAGAGFASSRYLGMTLHCVPLSTVTTLDLPNTDFQVIDPFTGKPVAARATAEDLLVALDFNPVRGKLGERFAIMHEVCVAETSDPATTGAADPIAMLRRKYALA